LAVLEAKEHWTVALNASRSTSSRTFFPDVLRLQHWHRDLLSTRTVHLFAHNLLDLLQDALTQWQVAIYPSCQLTNKASPHEQFLVDAFSISWRLTQRFCE